MTTSTRVPVLMALLALTTSPTRARAQVPPETQKLYDKAAAELDKKDYENACPDFKKLSSMLPDNSKASFNLAVCYEEWGKLGSALRQYEVAQAIAKRVKDTK